MAKIDGETTTKNMFPPRWKLQAIISRLPPLKPSLQQKFPHTDAYNSTNVVDASEAIENNIQAPNNGHSQPANDRISGSSIQNIEEEPDQGWQLSEETGRSRRGIHGIRTLTGRSIHGVRGKGPQREVKGRSEGDKSEEKGPKILLYRN